MNAARWMGAAAIAVIAATLAAWPVHRLPAVSALERALDSHATQTRRDTVRIHKAVAAATSALTRQQSAVQSAIALNDRATVFAVRADSAHAAEARAASVADSVEALGVAYLMRTAEATALRSEVAVGDTALSWASIRSDSLGFALSVSEGRAQRADSVLAIAARARDVSGDCTLMKLVPCPTRKVLGWLLIAVAIGALRR